MRRFLYLVMMVCTAFAVHAQVITWSVKPGTYDKIEPCWNDLYLVYKGSSVGVINGDGREIVQPEASRITGFYGGQALVLRSVGGQERILGILASNGSYTRLDNACYAIPGQELYSEGLLTVNKSGHSCYMDVNGNIVKEFDDDRFISPFSEGCAVVGEYEDYSLVDKKFRPIAISIDTNSGIGGGTNVYQGKAIVAGLNGKYYVFDVKAGRCMGTVKVGSSGLEQDYLCCYIGESGRSWEIPYDSPERLSTVSAVKKEKNNDGYGYAGNDKTILPCQLEEAEDFYGNYAIAKNNRGYGLLYLHNSGENFAANALNKNISYYQNEGRSLVHRFGVTMPTLLAEEPVSVKVRDESGFPVEVTSKGDSYEFSSNGSSGTKNFSVEVDAAGLKLWEGDIAYNYTVRVKEVKRDNPIVTNPDPQIKQLTVKLNMTNTHANKDNRCIVNATVYNPNSRAVTATVTITGSGTLAPVSQKVTIEPRGSKVVSTYFIIKKAVSRQYVNASTNYGGSAALNNLELIPF